MNSKNKETGKRLTFIVSKYFGSAKMLSEITGILQSALSQYMSGQKPITVGTAMKLQDKADINKDFILAGILPEVINNWQPIKPTAHSKEHKSNQTDNLTARGIAKHSILTNADGVKFYHTVAKQILLILHLME